MKPLKRIEDYLLAWFKLGKIHRTSKQAIAQALHATAQTQNALTDSRDVRRDAFERLDSIDRIIKHLHDNITDALTDSSDVRRDVFERLDSVDRIIKHLRDNTTSELRDLKTRHTELARNYTDLTRRLDHILLAVSGTSNPVITSLSALEAKNDGLSAIKDSFYHRLENKFRGTPADIKMRLRIYLPEVEAAVLRCAEKPVLDIGCGRGEWLELLSESDLPAFGVDTNPVQIAEVVDAGLDARQMDARATLTAQPDNSLSCITAHHLIEHLPFDEVLWIAREAMRVLAPGGLLLFETPNVRNILVGATSFHNDPTHLKPMTDPVLSILFETVGFGDIDIRRLHPHEKLEIFQSKAGFDPEVAALLFGPQDLTIMGTKSIAIGPN